MLRIGPTVRRLYIWLVSLHPRPFRERFGEEMIDTFDEAAAGTSALPLIADGFASLVRQWLLRPRPPRSIPATAHAGTAVPTFQTLDNGLPRRSALLNGGIVSLALLSLMVFGVGRNERFPRMLIGAHYSRPNVLPVDRDSITAQDPTTEVNVTRPSADPLGEFARQYFKSVRVLAILDGDHDLSLSPAEIATAPLVLPRLDGDFDGRIDAAECGMDLGEGSVDKRAARLARFAFMRGNPVLAVLDRDHDIVIAEDEVRHAAASLRNLDSNGDGRLSPEELLPSAAGNQ